MEPETSVSHFDSNATVARAARGASGAGAALGCLGSTNTSQLGAQISSVWTQSHTAGCKIRGNFSMQSELIPNY